MNKTLFAIALIGAAGAAHAAPLNLEFDDLAPDITVGSYMGFSFSGGLTTFTQSEYLGGYGDTYPFPSAETAVYNAYGSVTEYITHAGDFDFIGGFFTSWDFGNAQWWASTTSVTVAGYDDSVLVGSVTLNLTGGGFQYLGANFTSIDTLVITNDGLDGHWYLMDSLKVDNVESVPEPASMAVLGLGAVAFLKRRRSRA